MTNTEKLQGLQKKNVKLLIEQMEKEDLKWIRFTRTFKVIVSLEAGLTYFVAESLNNKGILYGHLEGDTKGSQTTIEQLGLYEIAFILDNIAEKQYILIDEGILDTDTNGLFNNVN